jgi:uncharacterized Zn-binding protein involved in type VI secretion
VFAAAREGDPLTHDLLVPSGVIAPPLVPCPPTMGPVMIEGMPGAHVTCSAVCSGATMLGPAHPPPPPLVPPPPIVLGSPTVFIHGKPAARWAPSGDMSACGAFLGDPKLVAARTVLIGNGGGVRTDLGMDIDVLASLSPSLSAGLNDLKKKGWRLQVGPAGKGSYCQRAQKVIVLDQNDLKSPAVAVQTLAHEAGHAQFKPAPAVPAKGLTRAQYIKANVSRHLDDEGAANFSNARARQEIVAGGGPDIQVAGAQNAKYQQIYRDQQAGRIDRPTAEHQMGTLFGQGESTSTTGQKYDDYYGDGYAKHWDATYPGVPPGAVAP